MPRWIGLLRGINVGGNRMVPMAELRKIVEGAGAKNVVTYIQSGNVVFDHASRSATKLALDLEKRIAKKMGFDVPVILRTAGELEAVIDRNPFGKADADHLHVSFLALPPAPVTLDPEPFHPETFAIVDRDVYLHCPNGLGRSKLAGTLAKQKPLAAATTRNWRTVLQLRALATKPT